MQPGGAGCSGSLTIGCETVSVMPNHAVTGTPPVSGVASTTALLPQPR